MKSSDLVIVGAGPAGLAASIYADRAAIDCLTIEQGTFGGQLGLTDLIDNYPGIEEVSGYELAEKMHAHAEHLGARFELDGVESISWDAENRRFTTFGYAESYESKALIIATGGTPRPAGFAGEEAFRGHGVSYCATCDGMFYKDKLCYVVGGGNTACEEAEFLTRFASKVILVVRKDHLRAQPTLIAKVQENPKIEVHLTTRILSLEGGMMPERIVLEDTVTGETTEEAYEPGSFGVFVFIGNIPASEIVRELVDVNEFGEIRTNEAMETATPGLFAAGDVREKPLRQIVTAVADGAIAATSAALYLGAIVI